MSLQNQTHGPGSFGWNSIGDVFLTGVNKYMNIREAEKMAEITGEAQLYNNQAIEVRTQPNREPTSTQANNYAAQGEQSSGNLIGGIDNKLLLLGGAGVLALLLVLKK